ncbi:MAG: ATP-binding cassette domain-containing protein [Spirochaetaceae bacterium]|jgi:peptide/nickel transport system ATP-binding protein/oligopeptide transport system ATP-binding protein|nr:ATP-binding cassette domain-containing protein [Spirochaetaceae bacterium]
MSENAFIRAVDLQKFFTVDSEFFAGSVRQVRAVDGVSFEIKKGNILGIVGESGCGKTTVSRLMVNLLKPSGGTVYFDSTDITHIKNRKMRDIRRRMQIVFQDPFSSLDPRMTVYEIIGEGLKNYGIVKNTAQLREKVETLVEKCGLFADQCLRYPHQFSGGQRQRICIARALAVKPDFIVLDEAVSALDVSIQAQILNLLKNLQEEMGLTYLFVSHDLSVVEFISDEVAVMYLGRIVELGRTEDIFNYPRHPYTEALLSAAPAFTAEEKAVKKRIILAGDIPSPENPPQGCYFSTRCPYTEEICKKEYPEYRMIGPGHAVACYRAGEDGNV